jgi:single stranded DNA-binding protein (ssb)
MSSWNKIIIVGYLGGDIELSHTKGTGTAVANVSIATTEKRTVGGESEDVTTWFRLTFWGRQAELASQYLGKGLPVYVEGRLILREWEDRDGNPRTTAEVNVTDMHFIPKNDGYSAGNGDDEAEERPTRKTATKKTAFARAKEAAPRRSPTKLTKEQIRKGMRDPKDIPEDDPVPF